MKKIIVVGGGAAGFFAAINHKISFPQNEVLILEQSPNVLQKVRVSGGGRCNVTNNCFVIKQLAQNYPRGSKELLQAFHYFQAADTVKWFEKRGVPLKTEADNRMFPITDSSQTIIDCFLEEARRLKIKLFLSCGVENFEQKEEKWLVYTKNQVFEADSLLITTGSSPKIWSVLKKIGHNIEAPIPSLFTFTIKDDRLTDLQGLSVEKTSVRILQTKLAQQGALLITHWGLSAPAILKLSAWAAKELYEKKYHFWISVNFLENQAIETTQKQLLELKISWQKRKVWSHCPYDLPSRLWKKLVQSADIQEDKIWGEVSNKHINKLTEQLCNAQFEVNGKSTFKDEFVTCGGVSRSEIDFKTMQSRLFGGLFFAGEVIDIDAVTGGFNFQAAWTTAWIAAQGM